MLQLRLIDFFVGSSLIFYLSSASAGFPAEGLNQKLLVVSFDGFRQLYLSNGTFLPWFNEFAASGVVSYNVQSVFPSSTFPNHWSIVTGMYAESHGIVANSFYDPHLNMDFKKYYDDLAWWDQAVPIWTTAKWQGKKKTSVTFWPGSSVVYPNDGVADYYRDYDESVPFQNRVDDTVDYLANKDVDLAFMYFHEPDNTAHENDYDSDAVDTILQKVDWYLSYLLMSLEKAELGPDVLNVVICADHGMVDVTTPIWIDDYVDVESTIEKIPNDGPFMMIMPKSGKTAELMENLSEVAKETGLFDVYLKNDIPAEFHYSNNDRILDILIVCKLGVVIGQRNLSWVGEGNHGYDPQYTKMKPIFMARGPAFKKNGYEVTTTFETKDIYAIIAHVVGIEPAETNATFDAVSEIFAENSATFRTPASTGTSLAIYVLAVVYYLN